MQKIFLKRLPGIVLFALLAAAGTLHADSIPNGLQKSICSGNQEKSSGRFLTASDGRQEFEKLVGTTNFCTNEKVSLSMGLGASLTDEVTCICTNQQEFDHVGCDAGQTQPTVTTIISKSQSDCKTDVITLSKCIKDPEAAYKAACASGQSMPQVTPSPAAGGQAPQAGASAPLPTKTASVTLGGSGALPTLSSQPANWAQPTTPAEPDASGKSPASEKQTPLQNLLAGVPGGRETSSGQEVAPDVEVHPEKFGAVEKATQGTSDKSKTDDSERDSRSAWPTHPASPEKESNSLGPLLSMFGGGGGGFGGNMLSSLKDIFSSLFGGSSQKKPPPPPPPSVSLTAEPATVKKGNTISLNWTSNATILNPPCQLTQNGAVLAQSNAGAQAVTTSSSTPETLTFTLKCVAARTGLPIQQDAVVNVQ